MQKILENYYHETDSEFRIIATKFLVRDHNFELSDARYEAEIISKRLGLKELVDNPISYLRMHRTGARKILNRQQRKKLLPSITNAIKHASFTISTNK